MSMDLNTSSPKSESDPDEKEISDDDDDRNHKHRRRDTESQSLERDQLEQASTHPFRKRNRTFQNGQLDPQFQHNTNRDFPKRRLTGSNFPRFSGQHGFGRGRGRDFQWDPRFNPIDSASQMGHPGPIPPPMFTGRGLSISNAPNASWGGFGLVPSMPNGTIDSINPLGLPGFLGPQMNPSMNMGMQRQQCRDFEERGFCLRGDMCPMEHGVNRIVVEDVQSLSHFNLPVSLSSAQMLGTPAGSGFVSGSGVSNTLMNNRGSHSRIDKSSVEEEALGGAVNAGGADVYDPDQPLWNNSAPETSSPFLGFHQSNFDESASHVNADLSDSLVRSSGDVGGQSSNSSVWRRLKNSTNKMELKGKFDMKINASDNPATEICEPSSGIVGAVSGPKTTLPTSKLQNDVGGIARKSSQKAECTLYVNCIPLKDNKRENLLSHFRKFGEVIDIHIPANTERAFVQFSKREEAEKALKAPDAVMSSRFIKLWWANRDNIAFNGVSSGNNLPNTPHDVMGASRSSHIAFSNKGKQLAPPKVVFGKPSDSNVAPGNNFKPVAMSSPKVATPAPKKMESLELLKEELRKKQEMLERKRSEFRQQLDKLAKQASGNSEVPAASAEKGQIRGTPNYASKDGSTQPSDMGISMRLSKAEVSADSTIIENPAKAKSAGALQNPSISKQSTYHMAASGVPSPVNRYKLDNRPKTFIINAPLPGRLTNVDVLRDHFSSYGEISNVTIEDSGEEESLNNSTDSEVMRSCSARVSFATHQTAERAFLNAKTWDGHNLHFSWVTSSIPTRSQCSRESSSTLKGTVNIEVQSTEKTVNDETEKSPLDPNLCPPKSSNELSSDSAKTSSPAEKDSHFQVQSPDSSIGHLPLEADEPGNQVSERHEEEDTFDVLTEAEKAE